MIPLIDWAPRGGWPWRTRRKRKPLAMPADGLQGRQVLTTTETSPRQHVSCNWVASGHSTGSRETANEHQHRSARFERPAFPPQRRDGPTCPCGGLAIGAFGFPGREGVDHNAIRNSRKSWSNFVRIAGSAATNSFPRNFSPHSVEARASRIGGTEVAGLRRLNVCCSMT
jgi:hypothetical protein